MISHLSLEEIIEINKLVLEETNEIHKFLLERTDDLQFILMFIENNFDKDLYKKSAAYCVALIVLHPFKNGNHRTSLIAAERFLLKNNFQDLSSDEEDLELQKWRIDYEQKHDLEREFFRITCIENTKERTKEIIKIMNFEYGKHIEKWLKNNFSKT